MYFRGQKKLQGEVSLSDSIDIDKEGNALQLMDVVGVDDTMLDDLHERDNALRLRKLVQERLSPPGGRDHPPALRPGWHRAADTAGGRLLLRHFPQLCVAPPLM